LSDFRAKHLRFWNFAAVAASPAPCILSSPLARRRPSSKKFVFKLIIDENG